MKAHFSVERWGQLLSAFYAAQGRFHAAAQARDRVGAEMAFAELEQVLGDLALEAARDGAPEGLAEMIQMVQATVEEIRRYLEGLRKN